jgi:hypothetical protein
MPSTRLVSEALVETRMRTVYIALQCGAGKRNRTSDLRITNALLYQLSYSGENLILKHGLLRRQIEGNAVYKKRSNNLRLCLSN